MILYFVTLFVHIKNIILCKVEIISDQLLL